jgi:hypothetical protein
MQITSVRYRELVSLRGCEHKALHRRARRAAGTRPGLLILAAVCAFERELTDSANIAELAPTASQAGLPPTLRPGHARCQPNWAPFCAPFTASLGHPI